MALGNRKAAADSLRIPLRSFYDRVANWPSRGGIYKRMFRMMECRKASGRRNKLRLEDSLQSGEPGKKAENPETIAHVLEKIKDGSLTNRDYPAVLREILDAVEVLGSSNWPQVRKELIDLIKEELSQ